MALSEKFCQLAQTLRVILNLCIDFSIPKSLEYHHEYDINMENYNECLPVEYHWHLVECLRQADRLVEKAYFVKIILIFCFHLGAVGSQQLATFVLCYQRTVVGQPQRPAKETHFP